MSSFKVNENIDLNPSSGLNTQGKNILPIAGQIIPFAGTSAPDGWTICDGTNGTPDLRGRFLVGARSSSNLNSQYGSTTHTHSYNFASFGFGNVASSHGGIDVGVSAASGGAHSHSAGMTFGSGSTSNNLLANSTNSGGPIQFNNRPHSHNGSGTTNYNAANHNNHSHNAGTVTEAARAVAHNTGHSLTATPSGNTATASSYQPFIIMNYIMKL
jgi:microcystin-dependent protein